jgi:hypothetical protein
VPASFAVVTALILIGDLPGPLNFIMEPIALIGCVLIAVMLLAVAAILAAKKRPRRAASFLLALIVPVVLWSQIQWVADCAHLGLTVGLGVGQLDSDSKPDDHGFAAYDWSIGLAGGPRTFLIRDETDEIALPIARHTHSVSAENGFAKECAGMVSHLLGHYYVCMF